MSALSSRSNSSSSATSTITKLQIKIDKDKDLIIEFETDEDKFCFIVILHDNQNLGWKEVQAIVNCLQLCVPGQCTMTPKLFHDQSVELATRYGKINGPARLDNGTLSTALMPSSRGTYDKYKDNILLQTCLLFKGDDNAFYFISGVNGIVFKVKLLLSSPNASTLHKADAIVFICVLTLLEPGDVLGEVDFLEAMKQIQDKSDYSMQVGETMEQQLKVVSVSFKQSGSRDSNAGAFDGMEPAMLSALTSVTSQVLTVDPHAAAAYEHRMAVCSPYPAISYRRALKESGQAQVYDGVLTTNEGGHHAERRVAIKVFSDGANQLGTYKAELKGLLRLAAHRNIVTILDFFEVPKPALVMEFIDGMDLCDYLEERGGMSQEEGLPLCIGIAKGLKHLHDHRIIHRDLKSANVLRRNSDGTPVIIDLGLSNQLQSKSDRSASVKTLSAQQQKTEFAKGTLMWMAPEMILAKEWSDRTDVYAFGIIMWEIFTGLMPFLSEMDSSTLTQTALLIAISQGRRPSISKLRDRGVEPWLCALIEQCWDSSPEKRPSINNVLRRLQLSDAKSVFNDLSTANSGSMSFSEFASFLETYIPGKVSPRNIYPFFTAVNVSKSGSIDFEEFKSVWKYVSKRMST